MLTVDQRLYSSIDLMVLAMIVRDLYFLRHVCLVLSKGCVGFGFILVQKLIFFNALCILDTDDFHTSTQCVLVISSWPSSSARIQFLIDLASEQVFSEGENYFHSLLNLAICLAYFAYSDIFSSAHFATKGKVS